MFKQNESSADRIVRIITGAILLFVGLSLTGIIQTVAYILGGILVITGITGFCAIYALFGISTKKENK